MVRRQRMHSVLFIRACWEDRDISGKACQVCGILKDGAVHGCLGSSIEGMGLGVGESAYCRLSLMKYYCLVDFRIPNFFLFVGI